MAKTSSPSSRRRHYEPDPQRSVALWQRDLQIFEAVYRHRFLTSRHILSLIDGSKQRLLKRLRELADFGYLIRVRNPAPRVQNQGSRAIIYGASNLAVDQLAAAGVMPRDKVDWTRRNLEVSDPRTGMGIKVVPHTLGTADVLVEAECCINRSNGAVRLITDREILATLAPEQTRRSRYPFSWHVEAPYPRLWRDDQGDEQISIEPRRVGVTPDKIFGIELRHLPPGENRLFFCLEYDRGTSPVTLSDAADFAQFEKSSIYKKLFAYSATWLQGVHTQRFGLKSFQVLIITESEERVRTMVAAFALLKAKVLPVWADLDADRIHRIFRFTTRASGDPHRLLRYAWVNGNGKPAPLASLPEEL